MVSPLLGSFANSAVPAAPKVGMIDVEKTFAESSAGKKANDAFEKTRKAKQQTLDNQQADLKKRAADLDKQSTVMKPEAVAAQKDALQKEFVKLQETYVKLERDLGADRTKIIEELLKQAEPIIKEIARAEGVNLIFEREALVWWDPTTDLTSQLIAKMK
jgi:outer membrane protein